jgi:tetratricopeptide (TPR) repeat protein
MLGEREPILVALTTSLVRQKKNEEAASARERLSQIRKPAHSDAVPFQQRYDTALANIAVHVYSSAGALAEKNLHFDMAKKYYFRAAQFAPTSFESLDGLLSIARAENRTEDQVLLLEKLIQLQPQNVILPTMCFCMQPLQNSRWHLENGRSPSSMQTEL